jgi:hypothetical protein
MIVYISIGNSDDKLSQMEWGRFYRKVDLTIQHIRQLGGTIHGRWVSQSTDYWQNACWCVEFIQTPPHFVAALEQDLAKLAADFGQDSIAWAVVGEMKFLGPVEESDAGSAAAA